MLGLAGVLGVSSATAVESAGARQGTFKIAWTHSSGPSGTNGDVFVMNADGSAQRNLTRHPAHDSDPAWSPDGRQVAFLSRRDEQGEIYVVNADGTRLQRLTHSLQGESGPAWSPDGRMIAFTITTYRRTRKATVELWVMNADGSGKRMLTYTQGARHWVPWETAAWSPDGGMLVFGAIHDDNWELYVINADGSGKRKLTSDPARDIFRMWLPDGRILFVSDRDGNDDFYVMNAAGGGLRNVSRDWSQVLRGSWAWAVFSPSGEKAAMVFGGPSTGSLYVVNADGSGRRRLVEGMQGDAPPAWSPDGRRIAFLKPLGRWEHGSREIFVVNVDGSGLQRLTRRPGHDDSPVWSPKLTG